MNLRQEEYEYWRPVEQISGEMPRAAFYIYLEMIFPDRGRWLMFQRCLGRTVYTIHIGLSSFISRPEVPGVCRHIGPSQKK